MQRFWGVGGMVAILVLASVLSTDRRVINQRTSAGSMVILIEGIGGIVPSRRGQIAKPGLRTVIAGTLANPMSGAIAGMLVWDGRRL